LDAHHIRRRSRARHHRHRVAVLPHEEFPGTEATVDGELRIFERALPGVALKAAHPSHDQVPFLRQRLSQASRDLRRRLHVDQFVQAVSLERDHRRTSSFGPMSGEMRRRGRVAHHSRKSRALACDGVDNGRGDAGSHGRQGRRVMDGRLKSHTGDRRAVVRNPVPTGLRVARTQVKKAQDEIVADGIRSEEGPRFSENAGGIVDK